MAPVSEEGRPVREFLVAAGFGSGRAVRRLRGAIRTPDGPLPLDATWDPGPEWTTWGFRGQTFVGRLTLPPLLLLHKPLDVVTSRAPDGGATPVFDLLPKALRDRVQPIGRLDRDTSGLLLLTGDGRLIQWLGHPRRQVLRTYRAWLSNEPEAAAVAALLEGRLPLRDGHTPHPRRLVPVEGETGPGGICWEIDLTEGKYHEVRRIFAATGARVTALTRLSFGPLHLEMCGTEGFHRVDEAALEVFYRAEGLELPRREVEVEPIVQTPPSSSSPPLQDAISPAR